MRWTWVRWPADWRNLLTASLAVLVAILALSYVDNRRDTGRAFDLLQAEIDRSLDQRRASTRRIDALTRQVEDLNAQIVQLQTQIRELGGDPVVDEPARQEPRDEPRRTPRRPPRSTTTTTERPKPPPSTTTTEPECTVHIDGVCV